MWLDNRLRIGTWNSYVNKYVNNINIAAIKKLMQNFLWRKKLKNGIINKQFWRNIY